MKPKRIGLIGDYNPEVRAHDAIFDALVLAAQATNCQIDVFGQGTDMFERASAAELGECDGMWCMPGSPYASMEGALRAIRFAREKRIPFLGTCGGFQHALIEYARDVLGIRDADHAESNPDGANLIISPLACSLVEETGVIRLKEDSLIRKACGQAEIVEAYHCRYGLNPEFRERLEAGALQFTGWDAKGEVRAFELTDHPFFVATLFQPERSALRGEFHPLIFAFVQAIHRRD